MGICTDLHNRPVPPAPKQAVQFSYAYVLQKCFDDSVGDFWGQELKHLKANPDKAEVAVDLDPLVKTILDFFPLVHINRTRFQSNR